MITNTSVKWGILFSLTSLLWNIMEYVAGYHTVHIDQHQIVSMFFMIPAIALMTLGMREQKKKAGGVITYGQSFMSGLFISMVVAVLSAPVQWIFFTFINPSFFETFIAHTVNNGSMNADAAAAYFNLKNYIVQGMGGAIVMGTVTSAIVALFLKSRKA